MVMRRVRRWDHFRAGPVRSGLRICREISGNGAAISLLNTNTRRRLIRTGPRAEPNAFIAVAVGNRASPVCARVRAAPISRISPATIWVSESSASANHEGARANKTKNAALRRVLEIKMPISVSRSDWTETSFGLAWRWLWLYAGSFDLVSQTRASVALHRGCL